MPPSSACTDGHPTELDLFFLKQRLRDRHAFADLPADEKWTLLFKYRVWHDPELGRHEDCRCSPNLRRCRCINPNCRKHFKPLCRGELFCCLDCFLNSNFDRIAVLIIRYGGNVKRVRGYLRKQRYRSTSNGKASREREYEKRNLDRDSAKGEGTAVETFIPPTSLDDAVAELFSRNERKCARIGCPKPVDERKVNGTKKSYCSEECREQTKRQRREFIASSKDEACPIAAYIRAIFAILYL